MNFGYFGHVNTVWIFTHIKTTLISNKESSSMIKINLLAVDCFISKVSLCDNRQKQQKEAVYYFDWKPYLW